jgi:NifU-like domain
MTYKPICTLSYLVSIFLVTCGSSFMIHPHTNDGRIMCHPAELQQRQISTNTPNPHQKRNSFLHQSIFLTDRISRTYMVTTTNDNQIISPFDHSADDNQEGSNGSSSSTTTTATTDDANEILDLTWENVEKVLDGMRHYLIQDGGNVVIADIDGPIVKLELQGACGTCPSSTQTMKMGYVLFILILARFFLAVVGNSWIQNNLYDGNNCHLTPCVLKSCVRFVCFLYTLVDWNVV